jgi:hypothetical protein
MNNHHLPSALTLLSALVLLAVAPGGGCSAKVEVSDENTTEKSRVAVAVGILAGHESEPIPPAPATTSEKGKVAQESRPTPEPAPREVGGVSAEKSVKVIRNVVNVYEGDLHLHEHVHVHGSPRKPRKKAVEVWVEVIQKPKRDERCEKLMREHLERVAEWEALFQRYSR